MSKLPTLSLLNRDYEKLLDEIKTIVPNLTDDWTDFSEGDLGMFILKIMAAVKDMQAYHFDMQQLENYLDTVTQRQNLISIVKPFGYVMRSYKAAKIVVRMDAVPARYTKFVIADQSSDIPFVYLGKTGEARLRQDPETGDTYFAVTLYQGKLSQWPEDVGGTATGVFSSYEDTNGNTVNETDPIAISDEDDTVAIDGSAMLIINDIYATDFTEVKSFVDNINEYINADITNPVVPKLYRLYVDRDNKTYLQFYSTDVQVSTGLGTATTDLMNSRFCIKFLLTRGASGSVSVGTELAVEGDNDHAYPVIESLSIGSDPETIEEVRENVTGYVKTMDRAVSVADYTYVTAEHLRDKNTNAKSTAVSVVDYYKNVTSDLVYQIPHFTNQPYKVIIYSLYSSDDYVTNDSSQNLYAVPLITQLTQDDNDELISYLNTKRMVGITPYSNSFGTDNGEYPCVLVTRRIAIKIKYTSRSAIDVKAIREALAKRYGVSNDAFGRTVTITDILNTVYNADSLAVIDVTNDGIGISIYDEPVSWSDVDLPSMVYSTTSVTSKFNEALVFGGVYFVRL